MRLTISRADDGRWISAGSMIFQATDEAGVVVLVDLPIAYWDRLIDAGEADPLTHVEELAQSGEWRPYGDSGQERIWRVQPG